MSGHFESRRRLGGWALVGTVLVVITVLGVVLIWLGVDEAVAFGRRDWTGGSPLLVADFTFSIGIGIACLVYVVALLTKVARRQRAKKGPPRP